MECAKGLVVETSEIASMTMNYKVKDPFCGYEFIESATTEHYMEHLDKAFSMLRSGKATAIFFTPYCDERWGYAVFDAPEYPEGCIVRHLTNTSTDSWDAESYMTWRRAKAFIKSIGKSARARKSPLV